ncbi:MAG TPA: DUF6263 family protein [Salinivirgaceae bacterium]|nr:DUF6263 family protein [Salinivirgaceae bacterium]
MTIKHNFLLFATAILFLITGCQSKSSKNIADYVVINEETNEISFVNSTTDPVELSYNYKKGEVVENTLSVDMQIEVMGQSTPMTMIMESKYEINNVDNEGNAEVNLSITRMSINSVAQGVNFDSNEKNSDIMPELEPMLKLLNKKVTSTMTPKGKILKVDYSSLEELGDEFEAVRASMEQNVQQLNQSTLVVLPEGQVNIGHKYGGEAVEQIVQGMPMRTTISYTIKDISEDKTMVIVGMEGNFEFNTPNLPEGISMEMKTSEISGWILIDISRGISLQSSTASLIELMTSQMGQSFDMILKTNAKMNLK